MMWRTIGAGATAVLLLLIAGCGSLTVMSHVPLSTMSKLATLDVMQVNPAVLRVAARLPENLEPQPGGVRVMLRPAGASDDEKLILEQVSNPDELALLAGFARPGSRIWVFRLTAADILRVTRIKAEATARSSSNGGSIAAAVDACHRGSIGDGPLPATTYLRTDAAGYFTVIDDLDLRSVVADEELAREIPDCQ